jgi:hypothetical protein
MSVEEHEFWHDVPIHGPIQAHCSCGWTCDAEDDFDALDRWENHCDVVFMEATDR